MSNNKRLSTRTRSYSHKPRPPTLVNLGQCRCLQHRFKRRCSEPNTDRRWVERCQFHQRRLSLNSSLETIQVTRTGFQAEVDRITTLQTPTPTPTVTLRERSATAIDAKRKRQFLIDSESLKAAKRRVRGNMKCEVKRYERGTDLTIEDWRNQMETYFTVGHVLPEAFVGLMLIKIVLKHLDKIK